MKYAKRTIFQVPLHPVFLLLVFNLYPQPRTALGTASSIWGGFLRYTGPVFGFLEGLASLIVVQVSTTESIQNLNSRTKQPPLIRK